MPKIIYLIGNGFDINAGFSTGAESILSEFVKIASEPFAAVEAKELSEDILTRGFKTWSDYEFEIGQYASSPILADNSTKFAEAKAWFDRAMTALLKI